MTLSVIFFIKINSINNASFFIFSVSFKNTSLLRSLISCGINFYFSFLNIWGCIWTLWLVHHWILFKLGLTWQLVSYNTRVWSAINLFTIYLVKWTSFIFWNHSSILIPSNTACSSSCLNVPFYVWCLLYRRTHRVNGIGITHG